MRVNRKPRKFLGMKSKIKFYTNMPKTKKPLSKSDKQKFQEFAEALVPLADTMEQKKKWIDSIISKTKKDGKIRCGRCGSVLAESDRKYVYYCPVCIDGDIMIARMVKNKDGV